MCFQIHDNVIYTTPVGAYQNVVVMSLYVYEILFV